MPLQKPWERRLRIYRCEFIVKSIITFTLAKLGRNQRYEYLFGIHTVDLGLPVLSNLQVDFQQNLTFQSFCLGVNLND